MGSDDVKRVYAEGSVEVLKVLEGAGKLEAAVWNAAGVTFEHGEVIGKPLAQPLVVPEHEWEVLEDDGEGVDEEL